jgi:hypothetical protein
MTDVPGLFQLMDAWRHLPAYQLERRADVFFALYLRDFLAAKTGIDFDPRLVPEFPIKRELIWAEKPGAASVKADYLLVSRDLKYAIIVELKTDSRSRRDEQDTYLERAQKVGMPALIQGVIDIIRATSAHRKYFHLASLLAELGLLRLPEGYKEHLFPSIRPGLRRVLSRLEPSTAVPQLSVLYLQPQPGPAAVGFDEFASFVASRPGDVAQVFAAHLRRWQTPAGG